MLKTLDIKTFLILSSLSFTTLILLGILIDFYNDSILILLNIVNYNLLVLFIYIILIVCQKLTLKPIVTWNDLFFFILAFIYKKKKMNFILFPLILSFFIFVAIGPFLNFLSKYLLLSSFFNSINKYWIIIVFYLIINIINSLAYFNLIWIFYQIFNKFFFNLNYFNLNINIHSIETMNLFINLNILNRLTLNQIHYLKNLKIIIYFLIIPQFLFFPIFIFLIS